MSMSRSSKKSKDCKYAELKEKLESLSEEIVKLDNANLDLEFGILDIVIPVFGNMINILMEKGTVQTRKRLLKWTGSHFTEMKKSMDSDTRVNPFLNPAIIQHLAAPEINTDDKTLRNLRQLSTLHNEILNPKYFDQVGFTIQVKKSETQILYNNNFRHGRQVPLGPETWDPIISAPTVRKLILDGKELDNLLSSTETTMLGGFNLLELISQISPYITTLQIDLPGIYDAGDDALANLHDFLQQFLSLRKLEFITTYTRNTHELDKLEKILIKIDNEVFLRKFEIELLLLWKLKLEDLEILLSPERSFLNKFRKFSLNIRRNKYYVNIDKIRAWAEVFAIASSIPIKRFTVEIAAHFDVSYSEIENNEMLKAMSIMNPYIVGLSIRKSVEKMENLLFTSQNWPRVKELVISCNKMIRLVGLSTIFPNLERLFLTVIESESIFTNPELTDEENLNQIFGNCANKLKVLSFEEDKQYFGARSDENPKITRGSKLFQYLQELLPNTTIQAI